MSESKNVHIAREVREKMVKNPYRAKYHIVSPEGVCYPFDPNGAIYYKGVYHLFHIIQLPDYVHSWAHLTSRDLLHWTYHPIAITKDDTSPEVGIFSGSAMMTKEGRPALIYHGVDAGNCIAVSKDDMLIKWKKIKNNPIIKNPQKEGDEGYGIYSSWDPHGWLEGDKYKAIFGGDKPAIFSADDLNSWKYEGPFIKDNIRLNESFEDYSCPDFFKLGDKYVFMFISHYRGVQYYIGDYKDGQFIPEKHERMNYYGGTFFANESLEDEKGRRILWGWVLEARSVNSLIDEEFLGTMSLPRELTLGEDGYIKVNPIEELKQLRYDETVLDKQELSGQKLIDNVSGRQLEIELELSSENEAKAGVKVLCSPDGQEETLIYYDFKTKEAVIDTSKSSVRKDLFAPVKQLHTMYAKEDEEAKKNLMEEMKMFSDEVKRDLVNDIECYIQRLPIEPDREGKVKLRIFVDASIVEVFVNDSKCITQRTYPEYETSDLVRVFATEGKAKLSYLKAWKMDTTNAW